jgi:hypothetical protein
MAAMDGVPAVDHIGRKVEDVVPRVAAKLAVSLIRVFATGHAALGIESDEIGGATQFWFSDFHPIRDRHLKVIAVSCYARERTGSASVDQPFQKRLTLERFLVQFSARFSPMPREETESEISEALRRIAAYFGADCAGLAKLTPGNEFSMEGFSLPSGAKTLLKPLGTSLAWYIREIIHGKPVR